MPPYPHHSVARQCVHCCKGDAASQWEMAILGESELRNPWTNRLKIWHVITSVSWPCMPNFIKKYLRHKDWPATWWNAHHAYSFIFFTGDFSESSTEKNTQQFQVLKGLKCSTVSNLGS